MKKLTTILTVLGAVLVVALSACHNSGKSDRKNGDEDTNPKPVSAETMTEPQSVKIYIDNSGSMRGYVDGDNIDFINAISDMRSLVPNKGTAEYWGDTISRITGNIAEAIAKHKFNGGDTPFQSMFAQMAREAKDGQLTFIVTDGIIGLKSGERLLASLGDIKNQIRDSIRNGDDVAMAVIRLTSGYSNKNPYYINVKDQHVKLNKVDRRPFYLISVGNKANVRWLVNEIKTNPSLAQYKGDKMLTFGIHGHDTALAFSDSKNLKKSGSIWRVPTNASEYNLAADMPECIISDLGEEYVLGNLKILRNGNPDGKLRPKIEGNTLIISCSEPKRISDASYEITVTLGKEIPTAWSAYSADDDSDIANDSILQTKTFALSYLLQGIYEGTGDDSAKLIDAKVKLKRGN